MITAVEVVKVVPNLEKVLPKKGTNRHEKVGRRERDMADISNHQMTICHQEERVEKDLVEKAQKVQAVMIRHRRGGEKAEKAMEERAPRVTAVAATRTAGPTIATTHHPVTTIRTTTRVMIATEGIDGSARAKVLSTASLPNQANPVRATVPHQNRKNLQSLPNQAVRVTMTPTTTAMTVLLNTTTTRRMTLNLYTKVRMIVPMLLILPYPQHQD